MAASDGEDVCAFCFQEESNSWDAAAAFINARRGEKARIEIKDNTTGFPPDLYGIRQSRLCICAVCVRSHTSMYIEISFAYVPGERGQLFSFYLTACISRVEEI